MKESNHRKLACILLAGAMLGATSESSVAPLGKYTAAERRHWAFQPRRDAAAPVFTDAAAKAFIRTPIDAFILEKLAGRRIDARPGG